MKMSEIADRMFGLRQGKEHHNEAIRALDAEYELLEQKLIELMEEEGLQRVSTEAGSLTVNTKLYPSVQDKDVFVKWAVEHDQIAMILSRANEAVFREYYEQYNEYPDGLDAYNKTRLSVRRAR